MAEEAKYIAIKRSIAKILSKEKDGLGHEKLFDKVKEDTGHGRVAFDASLNQMVGAGEVARKKKKMRRYYAISDKGRTKWL